MGYKIFAAMKLIRKNYCEFFIFMLISTIVHFLNKVLTGNNTLLIFPFVLIFRF